MSRFAEQLRAAGMSNAEADAKDARFAELFRKLREIGAAPAQKCCAYFVPGRVEVVGKHTDYAGGRSLICAIERGICVVAAPRQDDQVRVFDLNAGSEAVLAIRSDQGISSGHWSSYAATVARRLARDFRVPPTGANVIFASDLPRASGMSSSSALIIAIFSALAKLTDLAENQAYRQRIRSCEDLAGYLAAVETGTTFGNFLGDTGVGTLGGSEDHTAILCCQSGRLRQYSYCPVRLEREIEMPDQHTFVIGVSGVEADKIGGARDSYNRCSLAARKLLELWNAATRREDSSLAAALSSSPAARDKLFELARGSSVPDFSAELLHKRLAQFLEENNEIVPAVSEALVKKDFARLGELTDRSQALAEKMLGNQIPETIDLARSARKLGALAASAFGGGFGGAVWALLPSTQAEEFRDNWAAEYRSSYPARAEASTFLISRAGPGRIQLECWQI